MQKTETASKPKISLLHFEFYLIICPSIDFALIYIQHFIGKHTIVDLQLSLRQIEIKVVACSLLAGEKANPVISWLLKVGA